jgi:ubiquinone biosynthesis accessory factor UbiJ
MKNTAKNFFLGALQKGLNSWLALDPESKRRLQAMQGKIVSVELLAVDVTFHLVFTPGGIELQRDEVSKSDTVIKGTPLRLLHLALSRENRQKFFSDDVSITGNLELGQQVIDLFDHLEIDWEEILSRLIGDVSAHHLGSIARRFTSWAGQTNATIIQNVNEYVHEEIALFPPREAMQDFFHDVDALRMDTDRLEARVAHLQKSIEARRGGL